MSSTGCNRGGEINKSDMTQINMGGDGDMITLALVSKQKIFKRLNDVTVTAVSAYTRESSVDKQQEERQKVCERDVATLQLV